MKTTMPEPEFRYASGEDEDGYFTYLNAYTESQLRAAMEAAYNEAIEDAAKECEGMKVRAVRSSYEDAYRHAASAIRKLKEQTP